ncbi:MAG: dihydrofolate reductase family protein [Zetaproteobacteria bacterium]|nr:dihydrofolate reductase family protein [Zetaproteobacteria bacterium]
MIDQLYPQIAGKASHHPLIGSYLEKALHRAAPVGDLLIYANYIASLDGRISLKNPHTGQYDVPASIANQRDWRLYQELAAQADVMLTSARYFRQLELGCAQDLLPVGQGDAYDDLRQWRHEQGLSPQPDIVVISQSLDIPIASLRPWLTQRKVLIATLTSPSDAKMTPFVDAGIEILHLGDTKVEGLLLKHALIARNYRAAYMIAGPQVHAMLLEAGVLNRLFLTTRHTLIGGADGHSILNQDLQIPHVCRLNSLYLDRDGGQQFADYSIGVAD